MAYEVGQVVYTRTPAAYGVVKEILTMPQPTRRKNKILEMSMWFQPGDIVIFHPDAPEGLYHRCVKPRIYRLADQFFANGIRIVEDTATEIEKLRELTCIGKANSDGVNLESAIEFLEKLERAKQSN